VAYELVLESYLAGGASRASLGLALGALAFFAGDWLIDRHGGAERKAIDGGESEGSALAIVLGTLLDGIPESFILGLGIVTGGGVSVAYLAAVFLSNLPEAIAASAGLLRGGMARGKLAGMWLAIAGASGISAGLGYQVFSNMSGQTGALVLAFAGGAVLTMLADTMMPEAFEEGGKLAGLVTVFGFTLAVFLTMLE
jgi:ZIP family zinc transporter